MFGIAKPPSALSLWRVSNLILGYFDLPEEFPKNTINFVEIIGGDPYGRVV